MKTVLRAYGEAGAERSADGDSRILYIASSVFLKLLARSRENLWAEATDALAAGVFRMVFCRAYVSVEFHATWGDSVWC